MNRDKWPGTTITTDSPRITADRSSSSAVIRRRSAVISSPKMAARLAVGASLLVACAHPVPRAPVPETAVPSVLTRAEQLVVVTTPDWNATQGTLRRYARDGGAWHAVESSGGRHSRRAPDSAASVARLRRARTGSRHHPHFQKYRHAERR